MQRGRLVAPGGKRREPKTAVAIRSASCGSRPCRCCVTVTVACSTASPVTSATCPQMSPVPLCAEAGMELKSAMSEQQNGKQSVLT